MEPRPYGTTKPSFCFHTPKKSELRQQQVATWHLTWLRLVWNSLIFFMVATVDSEPLRSKQLRTEDCKKQKHSLLQGHSTHRNMTTHGTAYLLLHPCQAMNWTKAKISICGSRSYQGQWRPPLWRSTWARGFNKSRWWTVWWTVRLTWSKHNRFWWLFNRLWCLLPQKLRPSHSPICRCRRGRGQEYHLHAMLKAPFCFANQE